MALQQVEQKNEPQDESKQIDPACKKAKDAISNAEAIVLGIGAGMSASGGINYVDENLVKKWFPEYHKQGYKSIIQIQSTYWWWRKELRNYDEDKISLYWGYWAKHIDFIRFKSELLSPYKNIYKLVKDKNYFIITTNADGQTQKSQFDSNKIFAMQGNYDSLQCVIPCKRDTIYSNKDMIDDMVASIKDDLKIDKKLIPRCPNCKNYLIPNLRADGDFVEKPHMIKQKEYLQFIDNNSNKNIVFIELGVGFNTPGIIRFPFEKLTYKLPNATLIRMNLGTNANIPKEIENKSISVDKDIDQALIQML